MTVLVKRTWKAWLLFAAFVTGCNLQPIMPTPTDIPTATFVPAESGPADINTAATPIQSIGPVNPNCPATPAGWVQYEVQPGDQLGALALQTDSSLQELIDGNCLENPDAIQAGTIIFLPREPTVG